MIEDRRRVPGAMSTRRAATTLPAVLLALIAGFGRGAPAPAGPGSAADVDVEPPGSRGVAPLPRIDWARHGLTGEGCFLLRDLSSGDEQVNDAARCARPRRPNSTFKVVNALIGADL